MALHTLYVYVRRSQKFMKNSVNRRRKPSRFSFGSYDSSWQAIDYWYAQGKTRLLDRDRLFRIRYHTWSIRGQWETECIQTLIGREELWEFPNISVRIANSFLIEWWFEWLNDTLILPRTLSPLSKSAANAIIVIEAIILITISIRGQRYVGRNKSSLGFLLNSQLL